MVDKEKPSEAGTPPQGLVRQQRSPVARSSCHIEEIREPSPLRKDRPLPARDVQPKNEQLPQRNSRPVRNKQELDDSLLKTYHFFLLIENKKLTNVVILTGNDLETSGLLYSAMFCTNQKNASLICKSSIFIHNCQNYSSEKWRKFHVMYKALL